MPRSAAPLIPMTLGNMRAQEAADMVQVTVRYHDQIYALWRDSGPAQVRLQPGKAAEGWAEFLAKAGIDKDTLPSCVDHQHVVRDLDHRLHEVCLQHRGKFSFRDVHGQDRPDRNLPITIRDHGRPLPRSTTRAEPTIPRLLTVS